MFLIFHAINADECSEFTDCYNCTANYYYYNKTKCQWKEGVCFSTDKSNFKFFWEAFDACTDNASTSTKEKYCGSGTFSGDKVKVVLPQVDGKFATPNLFCKYTYSNLHKDQAIELMSILDKNAFNENAAFYFYVLFIDGSTAVRNIDKESYTVTIESSRSVEIYLAFLESFSKLPFTITIEPKPDTINFILMIVIVLIIFVCVVCVVILYVLTKKLAKKKNFQVNNQNGDMIAQYVQTGGSTQGLNPDEVLRKQKLKELETLLKKVIKPKKYTNEIAQYNFNCTICLEEFNDESTVGVTQCKHVFHYTCLKKWLNQNVLELRCPNCNYHLTDESKNKNHPSNANNEPEVRAIHFQASEGIHIGAPSESVPANINEEV